MPFDGRRVLSLESRRAEEIATLIRKQGGEPFVAPSMREVPLEDHREAFDFAALLLRGEFDAMILLTGVGTRLLWKTLLTRHSESDLKAAIQSLTLIVRGPKPAAALREITIDPDIHQNILAAVARERVSVSAWMTGAARDALQRRAGLAAVALWEKQHGRLSAEEMNEARRNVRAQLRTSRTARRPA